MSFLATANLGIFVVALAASSALSGPPHELRPGSPAASIATDMSQDKQAPDLLEPGKTIERALGGEESHTYQIELSESQYASVVVEQRGIDVVLRVVGPDGKVMADFDSESRTQGQENAGLVSDSPGIYQVQVKARYPKMPAGHYELRCVEIRAASEKDRDVFQAHRLSTEAGLLSDAGKYDEARDRAQTALDLGEKALGLDDPYVAILATKLGQVLRIKGELAKAEPVLQRAVSISQRALGDEDPQTASAWQALGLVYRSLDDNAKAEQFFQRALEITEKSLGREHPRTAYGLMLMALQYEDRGDFELAIPELQRALAIADKTLDSNDPLQSNLINNLGDTYLNQGDLERAEPLTQRALQMAEKKYGPDHPNVAYPLQNLGAIARQKGEYGRALEIFSRAQKIREKAFGPQNPRTASLLLNIGNVYYDEREYAKAREFYKQALDALQVTAGPYHTLTRMAVNNLSNVHSAMGDPAGALEYQARLNRMVDKEIQLNLAIGSEREKLTYASWMAERTDRAVSLHIWEAPNDKKACEMAAEVLLQRKARVFDAMSDNLAALRRRLGPDGQKLLDDLGTVTAQLAKVALSGPGKSPPSEYSRQLASLEEQREKLEAEISRLSAGYYEQTTGVSLAAVRAAIPADAALVEFAVYRPFDAKVPSSGASQLGDPRYAAYVIASKGEVRWKDLGSAKDIDTAAQALREALRDPKRSDSKDLARSLDESLIQPILPLLGEATHLLLSPDGELNLIPFEVLLGEQGRYLVEDYAITYLTTGRDLLRMQVARESKSDPLVIADPTFGEPPVTVTGEQDAEKQRTASFPGGRRSITTGTDLSTVYFAPLSGTAQEARNIQKLFPQSRVLTREQANVKTLKQVQAPRILHIATHGFFLEDLGQSTAKAATNNTRAVHTNVRIQNPLLRSGLAFSGANLSKEAGDDGILTALEASGLNLWGTKLVTLSACDTGVGEVKNREGVYGLRRAFFLAGTESLVMSLWPVSDYVTRELMTQYYTGLKKGLGRGEALRQAQLAMLKQKGREHPFYWASFIQAGEWANLDGKR